MPKKTHPRTIPAPATKLTQQIRHVELEFVTVYDDFCAFTNQNAFFCDAISAMAQQREILPRETVGGIIFHCDWLKSRTADIRLAMGSLHAQLQEIR
ncbi:hypothetical protein HBA55_36405 [Pseudomaricurvus alkylphenolicus]|uniref:hypothetical protein n=1 Tax=Pseudomaricurvus alkylphenolicus TaxID=1306991 RepID=UPI0014209DFE|nr:hypothetical protein [Pseudomaricurvus alkylphenolicus]NIB45118.1 hypothetical protein [Pseudomaricurvus alkylphenolicus]